MISNLLLAIQNWDDFWRGFVMCLVLAGFLVTMANALDNNRK